jgi:hypothetical protein
LPIGEDDFEDVLDFVEINRERWGLALTWGISGHLIMYVDVMAKGKKAVLPVSIGKHGFCSSSIPLRDYQTPTSPNAPRHPPWEKQGAVKGKKMAESYST